MPHLAGARIFSRQRSFRSARHAYRWLAHCEGRGCCGAELTGAVGYRTFRKGGAAAEADHAATRAIIALGRLKQMRTVAAGIEREDQLAELLRFECEYGQGSLFSDPVDGPGMLRLLQHG